MKRLDRVDIIKEKYGPVLAQIGKPLQFFALALLIVETLIAMLSIQASSELLQNLLVAGTGMFVLVVLMVVLIIFKKPKVLLAQSPAELLEDLTKLNETEKQVRQVQYDDIRVRKIFESRKIDPEQKLSLPSDVEKKLESLIKKQESLQKSIKESMEGYVVNINGLMRNASFYYYSKKYKKAIELYDTVLKEDQHNMITIFNKGLALNDYGKHEEAIKCYDHALAIDPKYVYALINKGTTLSTLGRHEEALKCYNDVLAIDPNSVRALYNKSCVYSLMGNIDKSLEFLKKAITLDSKYKELAKDDEDFQNIRKNLEFKKLMES